MLPSSSTYSKISSIKAASSPFIKYFERPLFIKYVAWIAVAVTHSVSVSAMHQFQSTPRAMRNFFSCKQSEEAVCFSETAILQNGIKNSMDMEPPFDGLKFCTTVGWVPRLCLGWCAHPRHRRGTDRHHGSSNFQGINIQSLEIHVFQDACCMWVNSMKFKDVGCGENSVMVFSKQFKAIRILVLRAPAHDEVHGIRELLYLLDIIQR